MAEMDYVDGVFTNLNTGVLQSRVLPAHEIRALIA